MQIDAVIKESRTKISTNLRTLLRFIYLISPLDSILLCQHLYGHRYLNFMFM